MASTSKVYVIAEAGSCHEGSFDRAAELVRQAKRAGVDAVKFQYCSKPRLLAFNRGVPSENYTKYPWSVQVEWLPKLQRQAKALGLDFMCTVYLPDDIAVVAPFVDKYKISSFEAGDRAFARAHLRRWIDEDKSIVISLGKLPELPAWLWAGKPWKLLHCVSEYPANGPLGLERIKREHLHGFSDHTKLMTTGAEAVRAGAEMLEVHFGLHDTDPACPDACVALNPWELERYVKMAREAGGE